jgi:hypothetical protein
MPVLLAVAALIAVNVGSAGYASDPVTLNGYWAPFTRCPVDDPAMLASQLPSQKNFCLAVVSSGGSFKLGNTTAATGANGVQFGLVGSIGAPGPVISPAGGAIVAAPVDVPGGLLGLMCPSGDLTVAAVCALITNNTLNTVSATVQQAGPATNFSFFAGSAVGMPIITLPIRVKLDNPLLGSNCYIGSDADPIVLHPANQTPAPLFALAFDADGTPDDSGPLEVFTATGLTQADNTFAVPGATGCGLAGALDSAINLKEGLPSPSGNNSLVLTDASSYAATFIHRPPSNAGQQFSDDWHSAICACPAATPAASPTPVLPTLPWSFKIIISFAF